MNNTKSKSKSPYTSRFNKKGNIKIGMIWSYSKLAGSGILKGCQGSCGKYCEGCYNKDNPKNSGCYVFKSYNIYPNVIDSHVRNTTHMREHQQEAFKDLSLQLKRAKNKPEAVRIHASGELESKEELLNWINLARQYKDTKFYIYTKAFDILDEVIPSTKIPSNFYINISIWHENGIDCYRKYKTKKNIRAFIYDDGYNYPKDVKPKTYCPAYRKDKNDKVKLNHDLTCDKCKLCMSSKAKVLGCLSH